jgi:hypothetical protein
VKSLANEGPDKGLKPRVVNACLSDFGIIPNPVESSSNVGAGKGLKPLVAMSIYPNLVLGVKEVRFFLLSAGFCVWSGRSGQPVGKASDLM